MAASKPNPLLRTINGLIKSAKRLTPAHQFPHINVDITNTNSLPCTIPGSVTISIDTMPPNSEALKPAVYRAILKAVFNQPDKAGCALLNPDNETCNSNQSDKLFISYSKGVYIAPGQTPPQ